jgi:hypothetical protein
LRPSSTAEPVESGLRASPNRACAATYNKEWLDVP